MTKNGTNDLIAILYYHLYRYTAFFVKITFNFNAISEKRYSICQLDTRVVSESTFWLAEPSRAFDYQKPTRSFITQITNLSTRLRPRSYTLVNLLLLRNRMSRLDKKKEISYCCNTIKLSKICLKLDKPVKINTWLLKNDIE